MKNNVGGTLHEAMTPDGVYRAVVRHYGKAVGDFFTWCERGGRAELAHIEPTHIGAYVEQLQHTHAAPSVKQHLAAVRMLFDWLVMGQVVKSNPASAQVILTDLGIPEPDVQSLSPEQLAKHVASQLATWQDSFCISGDWRSS